MAHTISSRIPTAPNSSISGERTSPVSASRSGTRFTPQPALVFGYSVESRDAMRPRSAFALSTVAPGRSRPKPIRKRPKSLRSPVGRTSGAQMSARHPGSSNDAGSTPTIVYGLLSMRTDFPSTSRCPENWRCQNPCVITSSRFCASASVLKIRPSAGVTPNTWKNPGVTRPIGASRGSPAPARPSGAISPPSAASSVCDPARQSVRFGGPTWLRFSPDGLRS